MCATDKQLTKDSGNFQGRSEGSDSSAGTVRTHAQPNEKCRHVGRLRHPCQSPSDPLAARDAHKEKARAWRASLESLGLLGRLGRGGLHNHPLDSRVMPTDAPASSWHPILVQSGCDR